METVFLSPVEPGHNALDQLLLVITNEPPQRGGRMEEMSIRLPPASAFDGIEEGNDVCHARILEGRRFPAAIRACLRLLEGAD